VSAASALTQPRVAGGGARPAHVLARAGPDVAPARAAGHPTLGVAAACAGVRSPAHCSNIPELRPLCGSKAPAEPRKRGLGQHRRGRGRIGPKAVGKAP
jgi:hypothetical protein